MAKALIRPHALSDRGQIELVMKSGASLQDIADAVWDTTAQGQVVLTINGNRVPRSRWPYVRPKDLAVVRGTLTFAGGGGGGKQVLQIVALIAVAVFASWAGPALAGAGTWGATALTVGITLVGSMLISAMFKPPAIGVGSGSTDPKESQTYSLTSQSNQATPYAAIPRVYGKHRLFPRLAATPFVTSESQEQYLYMLLDFGFGPLQIENLLIGETPLLNYQEVQYRIHQEFTAGDRLSIYPSDVYVETLSSELVYNVPVERTSQTGTISLGVDFSFPRGLVKFNDAGNRTNQSVSFDVFVRKVGDTAWIGYGAFPYTTASKYTTAVTANNVMFNADTLLTEGDEKAIYGLPKGATVLTVASGFVPTPTYTLVFPNGESYAIASVAGNQVTLATPLTEPFYVGTTSSATLSVPATSPETTASRLTIKAASTEPVYVSLQVQVPEGKYEVQLNRVTADSTSTRISDSSFWTGLRSSANRPPCAPKVGHCLMELRIKASEQLSGQLRTLSATCTAQIAAWDGAAWARKSTRNPASAFLDVLIGTANRKPVPSSSIDFESLQDWAEYCDQIYQGEPLYLFDHVVDYNTTIYQLLNSIASTGRATLSWRDGKIGVIVDRNQTVPAQLFTPRNSWGLASQRSYLATPHALRVAFVDPDIGYGESQRLVYADGYNETNATEFEDLKLFGVTRATQAWRDGRYMLAQGLLRREEFSIEVDIENLACIRGDLVWVQHDVLRVGGDSSRITTVVSDTEFFQFDPLPTVTTEQMGVRVRRSSDGQLVGPIAATPSPPFGWVLDQPIADMQPDDLLVWGTLEQETGEYLVKNIQPSNDFTASMTLVEVARAIYSADTGPIPPYIPPQNGRPDGVLAQPPVNVRVEQQNFTSARRPHATVVVRWDPPQAGNYDRYNVYGRGSDGSIVSIGTTEGFSFTVAADEDLLSSLYTNTVFEFAVSAVDFVGSSSALVWCQDEVLNPNWIPDAVDFLSSNVQGENTTLTWRDVVPNGNVGNDQVIGYDVRWAPQPDASFGTATRVADLVAWPASALTVPTRNGAYLIKPYTSSGIYSAEAKRTVIQTEDLQRVDYFTRPRFNPDWEGQLIDAEVVDGELRLAPLPDGSYPAVGYFVAKYSEQFNQVLICQIAAQMAVYGLTADDVLSGPKFNPLNKATPLGSVGGANNYDAKLWVASSDQRSAPIADWIPIALADPLAGNDLDFSGDARPIINGQFEGRAIYFWIELRSFDLLTTPSVVIGGADIDFPEREESLNDFFVPEGGTRVTFSYPFVYAPAVAISLQDAKPFEYVWRGPVDQYGFDIEVRAGDNLTTFSNGFSNGFWKEAAPSVDGSVDIIIQGVGRVTI